MASRTIISLPPMAPFPEEAWRSHMIPQEWEACLDAWILLAEAHLSLAIADFIQISAKDESVTTFLISYMSKAALSPDIESFGDLLKWKKLRRKCFFLS